MTDPGPSLDGLKMSAAQIYPVTSYYHLHGNMQSGTTNWAFEEVQCPHFSFVYECDAEKKEKYPDDSLFFPQLNVCVPQSEKGYEMLFGGLRVPWV